MNELTKNKEYTELINNIGSLYKKAKNNVISAINVEMLMPTGKSVNILLSLNKTEN